MTSALLTSRLVREVVETLRPQIEAFLLAHAKRQHLAIVVTGTAAINPCRDGVSFKDNCFHIDGIGTKAEWQHDYEGYALSKAEKSVRTGMNTHDLAPHYLFRGDTLYAGSAVIDDIVVACSGVESHFDEMISSWIAAAIKAFCKHKYAQLPAGIAIIE